MKTNNQSLAAFISPHGFGHATRAAAVLEAVRQQQPEIELKLFTTVPPHIFAESLTTFTINPVQTDVGIIQHDALHCDVETTRRALDNFLPFAPSQIEELAGQVKDCRSVLCDISPLGIAVAEAAGVPSILVENFTWDWIYEQHPSLERHRHQMAELFTRAHTHIQTEPVCRKVKTGIPCPPIFRRRRQNSEIIKKQLKTDHRQLVLISMGGIGYRLQHLERLTGFPDILFVLAGSDTTGQVTDNCYSLSPSSSLYHPDLIAAADLVVCKAGYSTVAECLQSGTSILCIDREGFAETSVLSEFVKTRLAGTVLSEKQLQDGEWLEMLPSLLAAPSPPPADQNGAELVAGILLQK
ncbi:glycosyltransferase [Desulfopila sp. IMCC35008]|uniref:glycosyltransferase n=1 Tax=Desulfopila sp. IMCC35008 TaxID=2653858 RepID=UPI0013D48272|nr:glycosyltransferase [Desulfopila sp. IMCC35008]